MDVRVRRDTAVSAGCQRDDQERLDGETGRFASLSRTLGEKGPDMDVGSRELHIFA